MVAFVLYSMRPYTSEAGVEALVDDDLLLCPMQHEFGWTFEHIDVERAETIESNKQGQEMYIFYRVCAAL